VASTTWSSWHASASLAIYNSVPLFFIMAYIVTKYDGKVERLNGTFGVMVRSLLYSSGLPSKYWSAALVHAVHL